MSDGPVSSTAEVSASPAVVPHTPGPWFFGEATSFIRLLPGDDGGLVCREVSAGGHWIAQVAPFCGKRFEEGNANARLIAAAPEMLSALAGLVGMASEIVAVYADVIGTESEPGWIWDLREAMTPAHAAIAKAEGAA